MNKREVNRFNELYERHRILLKLQGMDQNTIDSYAWAIRKLRTKLTSPHMKVVVLIKADDNGKR